MSWKTTLYDYVHYKNQMDMDYSVESLLPIVTDNEYLQFQIKRLTRTSQSDQDRKFYPVKSETRLTIHKAQESPVQVMADIQLKRTSVGMIHSSVYEEKRVERERVTLEDQDGKWVIARIQSANAELSLPAVSSLSESLPEPDEYSAARNQWYSPSKPFLNYELLPFLGQGYRNGSYDRIKAVQYADLWWDKANPAYIEFEVDCSSFVSQCLFAGGAPMHYTGKRGSGWWYKGRYNGQELWSFSWAVAQSLQWHLTASRSGLHAEAVERADMLELGDVICYDWNGDGSYRHSTVVTAKDANGMPLVNAHTTNSRHRYWSYKDSHAWTERTRYRFFHINDSF
jgi:hypothetical protein